MLHPDSRQVRDASMLRKPVDSLTLIANNTASPIAPCIASSELTAFNYLRVKSPAFR